MFSLTRVIMTHKLALRCIERRHVGRGRLVQREDASVAAGRSRDEKVELDSIFQPADQTL